MNERPIIFCDEMVRAILDDRKTQTRRVILPQPKDEDMPLKPILRKRMVGGLAEGYYDGTWSYDGDPMNTQYKCPYGKVGDLLWVREGWLHFGDKNYPSQRAVMYKTNYDAKESKKFKSPIFMPKWAARIWLEITGIRVERLQDITEDGAKGEGAKACYPYGKKFEYQPNPSWHSGFKILWDSLNAKRGFGWDTNPWVWVIEFKKIQR